MLLFDPLYLFFVLVLFAWVPGIIVGFALLYNTRMSSFEKLMISLVIGLFLPPLFSYLEYMVIGVHFSYDLAMINVGLTVLLGLILWGYRLYRGLKIDVNQIVQPFKSISSQKTKFSSFEDVKSTISTYSHSLAELTLIIILIMTLITRMASWGPIYFELDPYYYIYGGEQLLRLGELPAVDDTAWYPEVQTNHRSKPLLSYFNAHWYEYYTAGGEFEKYLYSTITSFYPPVAAVLLVFFMYLFIKEEYGPWYGVIAAFLTFTMPTLIIKMMSGTMEAQPLALAGLIFVLAMYSLMIKRKKIEYAILTGLGVLIIGLGATSLGLAVMVLSVYILLQGMINFITKQDMTTFIKHNIIILIFVILNDAVLSIFTKGMGLGFLLGSKILMFSGAIILIWILDYINKSKLLELTTFQRTAGMITVLLVALVLLITPLSNPIKKPLRSFLVTATYTQPLHRTIQEQQLTGTLLTQWLGPLGASLGLFDVITALPSFIIKALFALLNYVFAFIFDLPTLTQQVGMIMGLTPNLALTFLLLSLITIISEIWYRIYNKKYTEVSLPLLMGIYIFPVVYVGMNKVKYMVYAALGIIMATVIPIVGIARGICLFIDYLEKKNIEKFVEKKTVHLIMFAVLTIVALSTFIPFGQVFNQDTTPPLSYSLLLSSTMPKYWDNPMAVAEKFDELCSFNPEFCKYANPSPDMGINEQYDQVACFFSIIPNNEIMAGMISPVWRYAAAIRCSRINDYWIDLYQWMRKNTNPDDRITSWWDYGHWTNFFGDRKTVLRNEHASKHMIGMTAHAYLHGNERELWDYMKYFDSDYAVFDIDLIGSPNNMGGKYGALNYLGCAYANETNVLHLPGESYCEVNNLWDEVFIPEGQGEECEYSPGEKGIVAYGYNISEINDNGFKKGVRNLVKKYCLGKAEVKLNDNIQEIPALYSLNEKNDDGSLKLVRAFLIPEGKVKDSYGNVMDRYWLMFTKDKVWVVNNTLTSGWNDRTTEFYNSNLYKAFFLKQLDGFEKVYENKGLVVFKRLPQPPEGEPEIPAPTEPFPHPWKATYK